MSAISFKIKVGCFCPTIFLKLFYKTPRLFKAPLKLFSLKYLYDSYLFLNKKLKNLNLYNLSLVVKSITQSVI